MSQASAIQSYSHTDQNAISPVLYYRIRQVDLDARFTYTPVRMIKNDSAAAGIKVSSVGNKSIYLHFAQKINTQIKVSICSLNGQTIREQRFSQAIGQLLIPVENATSNSIYIVIVRDRKGQICSPR